MIEEVKFMNTSPQFIFNLKKILDYLVENNTYNAKIGNIEIIYKATIQDTSQGKRQIFEIQRKVEDQNDKQP